MGPNNVAPPGPGTVRPTVHPQHYQGGLADLKDVYLDTGFFLAEGQPSGGAQAQLFRFRAKMPTPLGGAWVGGFGYGWVRGPHKNFETFCRLVGKNFGSGWGEVVGGWAGRGTQKCLGSAPGVGKKKPALIKGYEISNRPKK